mgnify:CR=1 FL=1
MRSSVLMALILSCLWAAAAAAGERGLLLLAHGSHSAGGHGQHDGQVSPWNANVEALAAGLNSGRPTEVAFGMADPRSIQAALDRLAGRGVDEVVTVPLFVSSHSPIIGNFRYILGLQGHLAPTTALKRLDRAETGARIAFTGAMDAHPLITDILIDRAREIGTDPATTTVVLIAHGPNDEGENRRWLTDMEAHAQALAVRGGYRQVVALTHRNDAPAAVKDAARIRFREVVADGGRDGMVIVLPLLLSAGGIEREVEGDLDGLDYRFGRPLMPHPNIRRWVEAQFTAAPSPASPPPSPRAAP